MRMSAVLLIAAVPLLGCGPSASSFDPEDPQVVAEIESQLESGLGGAAAPAAARVGGLAGGEGELTFVTGDVLLSGLDTIRTSFEDTYAGIARQDQAIREKRVRLLRPDVAVLAAVGEGTYTDKAGWTVAAPPAPTPPPAAAPTLAQIGMFIYPAKGQAPEQQTADEAACTEWAEAQTGLELRAGSVDTQSAAKAAKKQASQQAEGAAVVGAAKGAVAGTAIGAIAGDTGKGAAIGAVAGAMGGLRARRQAEKKAEQQGAQQAQAQSQAALDTFKKAAGACLEGRGYTVK
jgi:hypothetical protein